MTGRVIFGVAALLLSIIVGFCALTPDPYGECIEQVERNKARALAAGEPDPYDGVIASAVCFS